jgi:hypothetical protein
VVSLLFDGRMKPHEMGSLSSAMGADLDRHTFFFVLCCKRVDSPQAHVLVKRLSGVMQLTFQCDEDAKLI